MIRKVKATTFVKALSSGRTQPCVMLCRDDEGVEQEVVVKLRASLEGQETGLICELLASLLADDLDLPIPKPCLVEIEQDFHTAMPFAPLADRVKASTGLNFGCAFLGPGYVTWPQGRSIPLSLLPLAADIFAFDVLIQNPDRRRDKPNLLRKDDDVFIFDHELAFSFLYEILPGRYPWNGQGLDFARSHVFFEGLKGKEHSWDRLAGAFDSVDAGRLEYYRSTIPESWTSKSTAGARILEYLDQAKQNSKALFRKISEVVV